MPLGEAQAFFDERARELRDYTAFLRRLHQSGPHESGVQTATAAAFVIIYNLIEATMTEIVRGIHVEMDSCGASFDDLIPTLQRRVLTNFNRWLELESSDRGKQVSQLSSVAKAMVSKGFESRAVLGSLNHAKIQKIANEYGFHDPNTEFAHTIVQGLELVREKRNRLAHGSVSFAAAVVETPIEEIESLAEGATQYLSQVIVNASAYLERIAWRNAEAPPARG